MLYLFTSLRRHLRFYKINNIFVYLYMYLFIIFLHFILKNLLSIRLYQSHTKSYTLKSYLLLLYCNSKICLKYIFLILGISPDFDFPTLFVFYTLFTTGGWSRHWPMTVLYLKQGLAGTGSWKFLLQLMKFTPGFNNKSHTL